jgi:hypothetical protein
MDHEPYLNFRNEWQADYGLWSLFEYLHERRSLFDNLSMNTL